MRSFKICLAIVIILMAGCSIFEYDPRPPLMDDNEFENFEKPDVATNQVVNTNINVIVSEPK